MKRILGALLILVAIFGGLYFGAWICFCKPVAYAVVDIITGNITAQRIAWAVFKIFFGTVGVEVIAWLLFATGVKMLNDF